MSGSFVAAWSAAVTMTAVLVGHAFAAEADLGAGTPEVPPAEAKARAQAVRETLSAIRDEVASHGGSWDAWAEQLAPLRADLERIRHGKWPWPAKENFRFLGRAVELLLQTDLAMRPEGQRPFDAILHLDRQLKSLGIDLIVMPIPDKVAVYPDYLSAETPDDRLVSLAAKRLLARLLEHDVEVIDLYTTFRDARLEHGPEEPLYYDQDSHWRNRAARAAAEKIAERLGRYGFVRAALAAGNPYTGEEILRDDKKRDRVVIVSDSRTGRRYDDVGRSPAVLTGDSFSMYNMHLKGHLTAQVALRAGVPLTFLCGEGLASTMPVELARAARGKGYLEGRRVVVWTFAGRFFAREKWPVADLPGAAKAAPEVHGVVATGRVAALSPRPPEDAPYPDYVMKLYLVELVDEEGRPVGEGDGVVRVVAMKAKKILPIAAVREGDRLRVRLTSWSAVEEKYERTMTGTLDETRLELEKPHYWGEPVAE